MTANTTLLLITADPNHPIAHHAYRYARALLKLPHSLPQSMDKPQHPLQIFFYADGAYTANQLNWQVADRDNLTLLWQKLCREYALNLQVCVSTALTRGITDEDNAKRHDLKTANLAQGFELVGLSELAEAMKSTTTVVQF